MMWVLLVALGARAGWLHAKAKRPLWEMLVFVAALGTLHHLTQQGF